MISNRYIICYFAGVISALSFITIQRLLFHRTNHLRYNERRKKAVFFGDSITQHGSNTSTHGWVARFTEWWFRRVDVINRGFSGYNTKWGLLVIDAIVAEEPDILFIFFGANDAVDERVKQHVSPADYQSNIQSMIQIFQNKLPRTKFIIITPPPIDEGKLEQMNRQKGKEVLIDRTNERALLYSTICKNVGDQYDIPVVDIWSNLGGHSSSRADYLSDGLHLNELGNSKVFEAVREVVIQYYPDWIPEAMSMHMLEWSAMIELENSGKI